VQNRIHEFLETTFLGCLGGGLVVSLQRVSEHPHQQLGDLAAGGVLCALLSGQVMAALGLFDRQRSFFGRLPQIAIAMVLGGLGLPVLLNQLPHQAHHAFSAPTEVEGRRCRTEGATPYLRVRAPKPWAESRKVSVTRRECNQHKRGEVVRFEYAAGALKAPWRRAVHSTHHEGFYKLAAGAWEASQEKRWQRCVDLNNEALALRPGGDGGRLYTNKGWCVIQQGDHRGGLELLHEGCTRGWTKGCEWLGKHETSYR